MRMGMCPAFTSFGNRVFCRKKLSKKSLNKLIGLFLKQFINFSTLLGTNKVLP